MMKKTRKTKILYKFLLFVLPFIILSIVITSVVLTWTSYGYFQKTINQDYENIIKSSAGEIGLYMQHAHRSLETLSMAISATKLDSWQKQMALAAFTQKNSEFISVSLISAQEKFIASTRWESQEFESVPAALFKKNIVRPNRGFRCDVDRGQASVHQHCGAGYEVGTSYRDPVGGAESETPYGTCWRELPSVRTGHVYT